MNLSRRRGRFFYGRPIAEPAKHSFAIYDRDDDMCYNYRNNDEDVLSGLSGPPVALALTIFYKLQRTGIFSGVQLSREVVQLLDDRQLIKHACARQSKRLLLGRVRDIPDPIVRNDFAELIARHAKQGDLDGVSLRLEVCRDMCIQLPLLESFSMAFERQSVEQLILQINAKDIRDNPGAALALTNDERQYSTRFLIPILKRLAQVPRNELFISIECDGSFAAELACMNIFRALRSCKNEISPSCEVRVVLHHDIFHTPHISESLAACCNVMNELRMQSASMFTFKSLACLLRSTSVGSHSSLRDLSVFSIEKAEDHLDVFCASLADCMYGPSTSLERLDFYKGVSLKNCVMEGRLGQALKCARYSSKEFQRGSCLQRFRFDAKELPCKFWKTFGRDVLPHLKVKCLSIYHAKWSNSTREAFGKGLRLNQYIEEVEFVYLCGDRAGYFRHDERIIKRYLNRNRCMHQMWEIVKTSYENKDDDPLVLLLDKLIELNATGSRSLSCTSSRRDRDMDNSAFDFTFHLVRDAMPSFMASIARGRSYPRSKR